MNPSLPNITSAKSESDTPIITEGMFFFEERICSRRITANIAVIAKSKPRIPTGRSEPKIPPTVAPTTQYRWSKSDV